MYFCFLNKQPISLRYVFKNVNRHRGVVQIWIEVSHKEAGPFETGIQAATSVWESRRSVRIPPRTKALNSELDAYKERVLFQWNKLIKQGEIVTGEMIMEEIKRQDSLLTHDAVQP